MREYREVKAPQGSPWLPQANEKNGFKFESGDSTNVMEGYLMAIQEGVGQNNTTVFKIHECFEDNTLGDKYDVWGDTVLNDLLFKQTLPCFVRIEYMGRKLKKDIPPNTPWTKGNSYHTWALAVDDKAIPYSQALGGISSPKNEEPKTPSATSAPNKSFDNDKVSNSVAAVKNTTEDDLPF